MCIPFEVEGCALPSPGEEQALDVRVASPGYFEAMRVPVRRGRTFNDDDRVGGDRVKQPRSRV
jgi:hypothetical protein